MTLIYRPYTDDDLALLQETISQWRQQNPSGTYCHPGDIPHRLYNGNRGIHQLDDITRIYTQDDAIVAVIMVYPRESAFDAFINPDFQDNHDLLVPILEAGEHMTRKSIEDESISVEIDCVQRDTARQSLLETAGFTQKRNDINETRRKLSGLLEYTLPDGFSIRQATMDDAEQLANVHNQSFSPKWTEAIYRDEVMLKPGYRPEEEFIVVAPDSTFATFTKVWRDERNKVGLFEPVGTHKNYRRKGLARSLMSHVMGWMIEQGLEEADVCHSTGNIAAEALYASLGFKTVHRVFTWEKAFNQETNSE